jgi:hypothetical protein
MTAPALPRNQVLQPRLPDNASVKLIGLGGVGSIVARYGALFLASLGSEVRLVLIDGDTFEPSNATRMFFGAWGNKAVVTRDELLPRFTQSNLALLAIEEFITPDNVGRLIQEGDLVLLTVDNHATRKLVNDHCARLRDMCLISGGNDGVGKDSTGAVRRGTYGNVQIYLRREGQDVTPPLTRHHPEIQKPADHLPTDQSCTELIASVPQILFANLAVASAILNTLWLHLCGALHYGELAFDIAEGLMRPVTGLGALPCVARRGDEDAPIHQPSDGQIFGWPGNPNTQGQDGE